MQQQQSSPNQNPRSAEGGRARKPAGKRNPNHPQQPFVPHLIGTPSISLIDIGVNLTSKQFSTDLAQVMQRAAAARVTPMIVTGSSVSNSQEAAKLCEKHPGTLFCTAGVHPHDAKSCNAGTIDALRQLLQRPEVVAVGECGLDFDRMFSPQPVQEEWFEQQLQLAVQVKKPVFLHERSAHQSFFRILSKYSRDLRAVVHCFTGTRSELELYLSIGCYIGITGWVTDLRRGRELQDLLPLVPLNRLLLETDAPYLKPWNCPAADRRNEPAYLPYVAETVAACMKRTPEEIATITTNNAREFFRLPAPAITTATTASK